MASDKTTHTLPEIFGSYIHPYVCDTTLNVQVMSLLACFNRLSESLSAPIPISLHLFEFRAMYNCLFSLLLGVMFVL